MTTQTVEEKSHSEEWGAWKFVSEMLDTPNPDPELARVGIYHTSKCYEQIHDFVVEQKRKAFEEGVKAEREVNEMWNTFYRDPIIEVIRDGASLTTQSEDNNKDV
jgi:hypothetical protein